MWENIVATSLVCGILLLFFSILNYFIRRNQYNKSKKYFDILDRKTKVGAKVILLNGIVGQIISIDNDFISIKIAPNVIISCVRFSIKQIIE